MKISAITWLALTPLLFVGACSPAPSEPAEKSAESEVAIQECDIAEFEHLVGQKMDILKTTNYPENTRIIEPGTMVTRDYRVDRMNIDIDDAGTITKIWCG